MTRALFDCLKRGVAYDLTPTTGLAIQNVIFHEYLPDGTMLFGAERGATLFVNPAHIVLASPR